jgi:hypothetical protein
MHILNIRGIWILKNSRGNLGGRVGHVHQVI